MILLVVAAGGASAAADRPMRDELDDAAAADPDLIRRLDAAAERLSATNSDEEAREAIWAAWFPQAVGILGHENERATSSEPCRCAACS